MNPWKSQPGSAANVVSEHPGMSSSGFKSRETLRRLSTLAPSPTALGPGESIEFFPTQTAEARRAATRRGEAKRVGKTRSSTPEFEPLEDTALENRTAILELIRNHRFLITPNEVRRPSSSGFTSRETPRRLSTLALSPTALSPGVHASRASVGSGDERSESPGESVSARRFATRSLPRRPFRER